LSFKAVMPPLPLYSYCNAGSMPHAMSTCLLQTLTPYVYLLLWCILCSAVPLHHPLNILNVVQGSAATSTCEQLL
jgi:hypothetical protein